MAARTPRPATKETDYEKVKSMAGRVSYGERYSAIILGACPHKVISQDNPSSTNKIAHDFLFFLIMFVKDDYYMGGIKQVE